ncbi:MAG: M3 family metallopeptidase, partial [Proteobacteria bacterium]|nr:M3 family metallopeptidase [Pseudomonadota bacterium]
SHFETNEPIPDALIAKIDKARTFNEGFATVEYAAASYLDMAWHTLTAPPTDDVRAFERKALDRIGLIPEIAARYRSTYFLHVFEGDFYSAGYYSYLWSQVLDADAFEAFQENGLFDKKTAQSFRDNILSKGGSEDPMELYERFRGRAPSTKPMLKRKGFVK